MRCAALALLLTACLPFREEGLYRCAPSKDAACTEDCVCSVFAVAGQEKLNAVWGSGPRDVWAAGDLGGGRQIAHYDGTEWKRIALPDSAEVNALWGSGQSDVWAAGKDGIIFHWDGSAWTKASSPTTAVVNAVAGAAAADVWAASYYTTDGRNLLRWNGADWTLLPSGGPTGLYVVLPFTASDVWAAGIEWGAAYHFDGSRWTRIEVPNLQTVRGAFGVSATDFWLAAGKGLAHSDGNVFDRRLMTDTQLRAVWASGARDVWAAGEGGQLWRGDGDAFRALKSGVTSTLTGVWGFGPGDVYVAGESGVLRFHP